MRINLKNIAFFLFCGLSVLLTTSCETEPENSFFTCENEGSTCNDGDTITINDIINEDCTCLGFCPEAGTNCDDGDATTENDVADGSCGCIGTACPEAGTACDDGDPTTEGDINNGLCECVGNDCPAAGTTCDDNDATTENDVENGFCGCMGEPCPAAGISCNDGDATTDNDMTDGTCGCTGADCPIAGTICDDMNSATFNDIENGFCGCIGEPCPIAGTVCDDGDNTTKNDVEDGLCGCIGEPCLSAGTSCDDGNPNTFNDVEDGFCGCTGIDRIQFLEDSLSTAIISQRVLIESRTAIRCPLCPNTTNLIDNNEASNTGLITTVKYHFGGLANATPDYRTEEGNNIVPMIDPTSSESNVALNRTPLNGNNVLNGFSQSSLNTLLNKTSALYIDGAASINANNLSVDIRLFSQMPISVANDYTYHIHILEDNIESFQAGGSFPYVHYDLFRKAIAGVSGKPVGGLEADKLTTISEMTTLDTGWIKNNLRLVVFVTRQDGIVEQSAIIKPIVE